MRFLNPTTDLCIQEDLRQPRKRRHFAVLLKFRVGLQVALPHRQGRNPRSLPRPPKIMGMKDSFVDVRATDEQGKHYIIEMQVLPVISFEQRMLYNACKKYAGQIKKGEDYRLLNDVIALTITDFIMFAEHADMVSKFKLRDESGRDYSDDLELIFVELPKFTQKERELTDMLDKWCFFLRYAQNLSAVPRVLAQEDAIEHAFTIANRASLSEEESELQDRREMYIQDQRGALEKALIDGTAIGQAKGEAIGEARGKAKGIEEGAYQKAISAAKNLKAMGLSDQQVAQAVGLTLAEVADL